MRSTEPFRNTPIARASHGRHAGGFIFRSSLRCAGSILSLGLLVTLPARAQSQQTPATSTETTAGFQTESKPQTEAELGSHPTLRSETALSPLATAAIPPHCVRTPMQDSADAKGDEGHRALVESSTADHAGEAASQGSGLMVFVDPESGQLSSQPAPGQAQRLLRTFETQERPSNGDVRREAREIPGVGVGVFVGDLFVHNLKTVPPQLCPEGTAPAASSTGTSSRYPVAVQ